MKLNYFSIFICFLVVLSICSVIYLYNQNENLKSEISIITSNLKIEKSENSSDLKYNTIRESYLQDRIDSNFNVLLIVFPLLLTVFGGLTYFSVRTEFIKRQENMKEEYRKQIKSYDKEINHIKEVESELNFTLANSILESVNVQILKSDTYNQELNEIAIVEKYLLVAYRFALGISLNDKEVLIDNYQEYINRHLSSVADYIKKHNESEDTDFLFRDIDYSYFINLKNTIEKVCNKEALVKLSFILSNSKFPSV